eukprot:68962-Chlamydomonas_euryale.AAC.1
MRERGGAAAAGTIGDDGTPPCDTTMSSRHCAITTCALVPTNFILNCPGALDTRLSCAPDSDCTLCMWSFTTGSVDGAMSTAAVTLPPLVAWSSCGTSCGGPPRPLLSGSLLMDSLLAASASALTSPLTSRSDTSDTGGEDDMPAGVDALPASLPLPGCTSAGSSAPLCENGAGCM